jgi:hypothetical protein
MSSTCALPFKKKLSIGMCMAHMATTIEKKPAAAGFFYA